MTATHVCVQRSRHILSDIALYAAVLYNSSNMRVTFVAFQCLAVREANSQRGFTPQWWRRWLLVCLRALVPQSLRTANQVSEVMSQQTACGRFLPCIAAKSFNPNVVQAAASPTPWAPPA